MTLRSISTKCNRRSSRSLLARGAWGIYRRYLDDLDDADIKQLVIHKRVSKLNYSPRCAEASAVQAHMKQGIPLAPVMEIGYVIRDALKWEVNPRENSIKVRCCVLSRAAGEGLGRSGICFYEDADKNRL